MNQVGNNNGKRQGDYQIVRYAGVDNQPFHQILNVGNMKATGNGKMKQYVY